MKIRNGFVSNSSSSSFILSYNKDSMIKGAENIIDFIRKNPNTHAVFRADRLGEGEDIFELTPKEESLLRQYYKDFCSINKPWKGWDDEEKDVYIYPQADMESSEYGYNWNLTEEEQKKINNEKLEKTKEKLCDSLLKKYQNLSKDNIVSEEVHIDNNSIGSDWNGGSISDFVERYLMREYSDDYYYALLTRKYNSFEKTPYVLAYKNIYRDKEEIIEYIKHNDSIVYMAWFNEPFSSIRKISDIDLYEIGNEERLEILSHEEDFLKSYRSIIMFEDPMFFKGSGKIDKDISNLTVTLGYGRATLIKSGTDLIDVTTNLYGNVDDLEETPILESEDDEDIY